MTGNDAEGAKKNLLEITAQALDLPGDVIAGLSRVMITGNSELLIENHRGILEYGPEEIDVNCDKMIIKVRGGQLRLKSMNAQEMMLAGVIRSVEFVY